MINQNVQPDQRQLPYKEIFPTAAALLWQDRYRILALYVLLVGASLVANVLKLEDSSAYLALALIDRLLQLLFTYLVVTRWLRKLSTAARVFSWPVILRYFLFGTGIWCLFTTPLLLLYKSSPLLLSGSFFLIGIAIWLSLRFYFYAVPVLLGRPSLKASLDLAIKITEGDRWLAIKLLVAPCGILSALLAVVLSFSPDGRLRWINYASELVSGIFWILTTYLAVAASFLRLSDEVWREENLEPYRTARLSTLDFQGSSWLARQLRPAHGFGWLLISALIWIGNMMRLFSMPPPGTLEVRKISAEGSKVTLELHLSDPEHHFQGLQPVYFALAGEQRAVISQTPASAKVPG